MVSCARRPIERGGAVPLLGLQGRRAPCPQGAGLRCQAGLAPPWWAQAFMSSERCALQLHAAAGACPSLSPWQPRQGGPWRRLPEQDEVRSGVNQGWELGCVNFSGLSLTLSEGSTIPRVADARGTQRPRAPRCCSNSVSLRC